MTDNREQIALRFPPGTREKLRKLAYPGEPMTAVILRGLAALEAAPPQHQDPGRLEAVESRLDALEQRLDNLSNRQTPMLDSARQRETERPLASSLPSAPRPPARPNKYGSYSDAAKLRALELWQAGASNKEIREGIYEIEGRCPHGDSLRKQLLGWADKFGLLEGQEGD